MYHRPTRIQHRGPFRLRSVVVPPDDGLLAMMPGNLFPSSRNLLKKSGSLVRSTEEKSVMSSGPAISIPSNAQVSSPQTTGPTSISFDRSRFDPLSSRSAIGQRFPEAAIHLARGEKL